MSVVVNKKNYFIHAAFEQSMHNKTYSHIRTIEGKKEFLLELVLNLINLLRGRS